MLFKIGWLLGNVHFLYAFSNFHTFAWHNSQVFNASASSTLFPSALHAPQIYTSFLSEVLNSIGHQHPGATTIVQKNLALFLCFKVLGIEAKAFPLHYIPTLFFTFDFEIGSC